ncbi:MAG TPA: hypothetical protein VFX52_00815 [Nocardioidaceae bacterium]|nr:hypothetical protein [Nocardioidaceae bacterium]
MIPSVVTSRMRLCSESAMNRFPAPSANTSCGQARSAFTAGPPSPTSGSVGAVWLPLPANVLIVPLGLITRMRSLNVSAT